MTFPQLRIRTEFSFRTTFGPIQSVADHLAEIGCKTAAIVDPGTWGHVRWEKALTKKEIQPAFGAEFNLEVGNHKPLAWCLAEELPAFYRFTSFGPKTTEEWATAEKGVIRFCGAALTEPALFDYIDLNPAAIRRSKSAVAMAKETGKKIILTGDNNYPAPSDRDKFLAITDNKKITPQHILQTKEEFRKAFFFLSDEIFERAWLDTFEVAERLQGIKLRQAPIIKVEGDLAALIAEGKKYRIEKGHIKNWNKVYEDRMKREMEMISQKEFESYFIVVADLVCWAKERMLVGPARGSSAGSLVCYLLRITEVDPIPHGLLFERFVDANRNDLPDIDIDFNDQKRELCFKYLEEKYGRANVARIGNINTLKPKSVMAEVGKRMGIPIAATFAVKNVLIEYSSGDSRYGKGLEDTLNNTQPGRDFTERYPEAAVMAFAENHAWHTGVHAAGIIVSNEPVTDYCTVGADGVAQLDKPDSEYLNLLKIDALGLRTLGIIENSGCVDSEFLYGLALDDPKVFEIINEGKFSGVFQFEGAAQRRVSLTVPIKEFKHIDHVTALARPGPLGGGAATHYINRNDGREAISYVHPSMAEYLGDTMGVVLYQEDIMKIVREIGKFSWEETSIIRKAMSGRKGKEYFDQLGEKFAKGAETTGMPPAAAKELWDSLCNYGAWCLSGDTIIELPCANQHSPKKIKLKDLAKNNGYAKRAIQEAQQDKKPKAKIWCANEDFSLARPVPLIRAFKSGHKMTFELKTESGKKLRATVDHKIKTPSGWKRLRDLSVGDFIICLGEKGRNENRRKIQWAKYEDDSWRYNARKPYNGRSKQFEIERQKLIDKHPFCKECGAPWDVCHHIDGDRTNNLPKNLVLLCNSHHKKWHKEFLGDKAPVAYSNGRILVAEKIKSIGNPKEEDVYDISMPSPNHNFAANGIIVHNCMNKSHTCSYAIISYWCCWMKTYHPLEYAAACLRNAKDDEQTIEILRELSKEGIDFTPFDPQLSDRNWIAREGKLLGGFTNLKGIGPVKAQRYIEKRDSGGGLTEKDLRDLAKLEVKNSELAPAHKLWGQMYSFPEDYNVHGKIKQFGDLRDQENAVVICKLVRKERRDENEAVRLAKRNGERRTGETRFLDAFVVDDSVSKTVTLRIRPRIWRGIGQPLADKAVDGVDWFLVRGKWLAQFSMMTVEKIKCLTNPELFDVNA